MLNQPQRPQSFAPLYPFAKICQGTPSQTYQPWSNLPNQRLRLRHSNWSNPAKPAYRQTHLVTPSYSCLHDAKFRSDNFELLFGCDFGMPFMFTFREVHSFAFDCVSDDHGRLIGFSRRLCAFQGRNNLRKVVPVYLKATPAKLLEYASQIDPRPGIASVAAMLFIDRQHPPELLQAIPVQNSGQVPELVSGSNV